MCMYTYIYMYIYIYIYIIMIRLYVCCGHGGQGTAQEALASGECLDPARGDWEAFEPLAY